MDVRQYYRKLREIEAGIADPYVLVTSLEASDGGKAGIISEVSREQAAKLMVEGRVTLSSETDGREFFARQAAQKKAFEKAEMARRLQVTIVSAPEDKESTLRNSVSDSGVRK